MYCGLFFFFAVGDVQRHFHVLFRQRRSCVVRFFFLFPFHWIFVCSSSPAAEYHENVSQGIFFFISMILFFFFFFFFQFLF